MFSLDDGFCSTVFWDKSLTWESENPDFTLCFEQTALVWVPCLVLWLLSPLELYLILQSRRRNIPWRFTNITKLILNLLVIGLSITRLIMSAVSYYRGNKIYSVEVWTPLIQLATFILALVLLLWNRLRGQHTSGVLFMFWLCLVIAGLPQLRTEIIRNTEDSNVGMILYAFYFTAIFMMLILNFFSDPMPEITEYTKSKKMCPEVRASFMSAMVFGWFDGLVWKGFHRPLTTADLWDLKYEDQTEHVVPIFEKHLHMASGIETGKKTGRTSYYGTLKSPMKSSKPISVIGPIFKTCWLRLCACFVTKIIGDALSFVNPQILNLMIKFVAGDEMLWKGILYAVGMFLAAELQTFFFHQNLIEGYRIGINWRSSLMATIYKKSLRISSAARKTSTLGEVVNLMAVDAQRCSELPPYLLMMSTSPIIIVVAFYFLWQIVGVSSLAGVAIMIIIIPINTVIANKVKFLQMKQMKYKDERIKLMNEVLSGIKALKLYAWEPSFQDYIVKIRQKELKVLRTASLLNASTSFIWLCSSFLVSLATFGTYVLTNERNLLTSETAFVATALFNVMRAPISFLPMLIQMTVQCWVSVKRINKFINAEELDLNVVSHDESREEPLIIEEGTFSWDRSEVDETVLRDITLRVKQGSLVAVVGAVGCGKSSLISAILGEMHKLSGYINTKGSMAYVPQQAWIQNATVRDNILFGSEFDRKKYYRTIDVCSLKSDFEMLPGGDATEIGEKGINLSGGQKQRVSLARAVYSDADTYLLDDPLSAVDSHVGKHIFENVIGPAGVLNKKTRILVTHGVTFLPQVDVIVVMKAGQITEVGTFNELLSKKGEFSEFLIQHITETEDDSEMISDIEDIIDEHPELKKEIQRQLSKSGSVRSISSLKSQSRISETNTENEAVASQIDKLIQAEKTEIGSVKWSVYMYYVSSAGLLLILATVIFQLLSQVLGLIASVYLSSWSSDPEAVVDGVQDIGKRDHYLGLYFAFGIGQMVFVITSAYTLAFGTVYASQNLHFSMLSNIFRSPMSFFDTTPTGRLVNRFGRDVDVVDNTLPFSISNALSSFGNVLGTVCIITWSTPLFASVIVPIGLLYYFVQKIYISSSRQLKRIEGVSRSPVYSHFSETVSGASSIRAYGVSERFIKTADQRVDANLMCLYPSLVSNRWLGIRLETVGNLLIFFAALFAVLGKGTLDAGLVGLSVSYALQITGMLNFAVRMSSEVENNIVSVERLKEYSEVPQEAAWELQPKPNPQWPSHGTVQFEDYQVRYREGLDLVLKGLSFVVNGGEKLGIVGRTGAGKSSLTLCLFRIIEAAGGRIYIDGVDIAKIGLGDLRSKLTIIPQDPVLFSGSLRMNLDPFNVYSDSDIWRALELAHLRDFARSLSAGLSHNISEGGENLSVGQRQLICLARALLRKTKLLILDEATAAIDLDTDDLIQQTIRTEFRDCTVLTIAHRLNTIMDSDRVVVLDKGNIKEFDTPTNLLKVPTSVFYGMAKDAGLVS